MRGAGRSRGLEISFGTYTSQLDTAFTLKYQAGLTVFYFSAELPVTKPMSLPLGHEIQLDLSVTTLLREKKNKESTDT